MRESYRTTILSDSPVAYWRMDESSGNLSDTSGNSNTATAAGTGATYSSESLIITDKSNKSIVFADNDNRFDAGDDSDFELTTFSVEAWINRTGEGGFNSGTILSKGMSGTTGWAFHLADSGGIKLAFTIKDTDVYLSTTVLALNKTYYCAATFTPTRVRIYVNGVKESETTTVQNPSYSTETVKIGNRNTSSNIGFEGTLDEIAFYNVELTEAQILKHYQAGVNGLSNIQKLRPRVFAPGIAR